MEDTLKQLAKEIVTPKFGAIKNSCNKALSILQNEEALRTTEAWQLREICLEPLQMALESRAKKLSYHAIAGIQHIFRDERFHSSLEVGEEEKWLPVQVLNTLYMTPHLPDDIQVEIMKLLLNMTLTTAWCMNAHIVTKISQLYLNCYTNSSPRSRVGRVAAACFRENCGEWCACLQGSNSCSDTVRSVLTLLAQRSTDSSEIDSVEDVDAAANESAEEKNGIKGADGQVFMLSADAQVRQCLRLQVYIETYRDSLPVVRAPIQAAMTQMLNNFVDTLREIEDKVVDDGDDMLADFKNSTRSGDVDSVMEEVVALLNNMGKQVVALLVEGVHAILSKLPTIVRHNVQFQEIIWKQLCPVLISLLGAPKSEKSAPVQRSTSADEIGRGSGRSSSAPNNLGSAAKVIYSIAAELVRLVGGIGSLRPVLQSLFHRMLLYPPPQHRVDALKVVKELLSDPERLVDMTAPVPGSPGSKADGADMSFIKLILDAVQECCHCNESNVCFTSVTCVDSLLHSLDSLSHGRGISDAVLEDILKARSEMEKVLAARTLTKESQVKREMALSHRDGDGGSFNADSTPEHVRSEIVLSQSPPDSPRPIVDSDTNSEASSADIQMSSIKRVTRLRLSDVEADEAAGKTASPSTTLHAEAEKPSTEDGIPSMASGAADGSDQPAQLVDASDDGKMAVDERGECTAPDSSVGAAMGLGSEGSTEENQQRQQQDEEARQKHKLLREQLASLERENAAEFVQQMRSKASYLLSLPSVTDVDEALQGFASNFCAGLSHQQWSESNRSGASETLPGVVLNADGVYTASVAALQLCYKLTRAGFYTSRQQHLLTQSQTQFVDSVLGSGLLLYLSPTWLSEVYTQTIAAPLMDVTHLVTPDCPLLQLIEDLDGLGSHEIGGQLMFEYRCDEDRWRTETALPESQPKVEAGQFLAQRILWTCWEGLLDVLSVLLEGKSSCGISFSLGLLLGTEGAREETQRARDAICLSLSGLQTASRLCCTLGLQSKCGSAFAQLANTSCVREDLRAQAATQKEGKGALKAAVLREKPKPARLHAAHILSMDVVMTTGLEVGKLEHTYFSRGNHQSSLPRIQQGQNTDAEGNTDGDSSSMGEMFDMPMMTAAAVPVAPRINVAELISQSSMESGWETSLTGGGVLTPTQAARALCGLSQEVDSLFESAARKLNLQALLNFLMELGESSRQQLHHLQHHRSDSNDPAAVSSLLTTGGHHTLMGSQGSRLPTNALHLYRLQEVLMTVVHSSRPLLHLVRVWSAVSPYLVEATGHHDRSISKMAVTCIHDFIVAMLTGHQELPHFHVNEFLCKTFEDMLCLEFVTVTCKISVRIEFTANEEVNEARQRHVAAVLDVFEVYLNTENILVFANATVDCILCLLKYVHGPGMFEDVDEDDGSDSGSDVGGGGLNMQNLCVPALGYLARCSHILASMWKMPACPIFKGAFRIEHGSSVRVVDPTIPHMDVKPINKVFTSAACSLDKDSGLHHATPVVKGEQPADSHSITSIDSGMLDGACLEQDKDVTNSSGPASLQLSPLTLAELDNGSGVLHVWYLLLDGLATAIASCPRSFQPQTLTTMFQLLRDTSDVPGPRFAMYCVNHLLLPMLQSWLRRGSRIHGYWDTGTVNFKQCCGLTADLVVEFIGKFVGQSEEMWSLELMLRQLYDVLTECVAQPFENLSLLGCSCIRHVLLSAGPVLTEPLWNISAQCFARAVTVTTYNLRQLMALFHPNSDNFYGDIGQVKVATRKDCVAMDSMRLRQLARQVFLLDSQVTSMPHLQYDTEEDKSFVFLLYPPDHQDSLNPDHITARVPFRDMVVGLLSNQLLLQTLGCLLLDGASGKLQANGTISPTLPGLLPYMSTRNIMSFLDILESSYQFACEFDARPGLKFLLQKVAGLEVAANQYRLAGASMVLYLHTLTHLCARLDHMDMTLVQQVLSQCVDSTDGSEVSGDRVGDSSSDRFTGARVPSDRGNPAAGNVQSQSEESQNVAEKPCNKDNVGAKDSMAGTKSNTRASNTNMVAGIPPESDDKAGSQKLDPPTLASKAVPQWKQVGRQSTSRPWESANIFLPLLYEKCNDICQQYADILADSATESLVDRMASRPLFFLIAQPDDIAEMTQTLKRKSKDFQKPEDSLKSGEGREEVSVPGLAITTAETLQDTQAVSEEKITPSDYDPDSRLDRSSRGSVDDDEDIDDLNRQCSKRQLRAEHESKVYSVATDNVIQNLIGQYKKHKQQNAMPNTFVQFVRRHRPAAAKVPRREPVDEAINKQQQSSIMKDSEAHQRSWSEMLVTVLQLFLELPDAQFSALLPAAASSVTHLICYAQDPVLRDTLAQWFQRLGRLYGFAPKFGPKTAGGNKAEQSS
ncbi:hypothetical protein BaRGS_00028008 [Batillaria attramentaria]|uniref:Mon2/Sec7/BIG1-like dimerisation and cyclophilin-binding domain-containing protein n=1 Tax=Batillaria attramentaria TaxID=370345 RepID=A0ABD0K105_9CAEN